MCSEKQLDGLCQATVAFLDCFEQFSGVGYAKVRNVRGRNAEKGRTVQKWIII
jgi:hypothetical protein